MSKNKLAFLKKQANKDKLDVELCMTSSSSSLTHSNMNIMTGSAKFYN